MSFDQSSQPKKKYYKIFDTNEIWYIPSFKFKYDCELKYIRLQLFKKGTHSGNERFRLILRSSLVDSASEEILATSDWFNISDISGIGDVWTGWIRFDFNRRHVDSDVKYRLDIESNNYTRNGDTFYIGWALDWPYPINDNDSAPAMELYGYL